MKYNMRFFFLAVCVLAMSVIACGGAESDATSEVASYTLSLVVSPVYGTVTGGGDYKEGETVTVTATVNPLMSGYVFDAWCEGSAPKSVLEDYTFPMPAHDLTLTAEFYNKDFFNIAQDGVLTNLATLGKQETSITVPHSVTSIGDGAFMSNSKVAHVVILDGAASIGDNAFYGCGSLVDITIPGSVVSIGEKAFGWTSSLQNLTLPSGVTKLCDNAFYASGIESIVLPLSVIDIGKTIFYGCDITALYYEGTQTDWNGITIDGKIDDKLNVPGSLTLYYYSETQPSPNSGDYWHYDNNGTPTTVWP